MEPCIVYQITDPDNIPVDICFKTNVWKLQQKYGTLAYNYLKNIQYGNDCSNNYNDLIMFRRLLLLLNRYDIRDIPNDTMLYNKITYTQAKNIITLLNNKY